MGDALLLLIPAAIAVALSPMGIVEMILVLFSDQARPNGIILLLTVLAGALILPLLGAFAFDAATGDGGDQPAPSPTKG